MNPRFYGEGWEQRELREQLLGREGGKEPGIHGIVFSPCRDSSSPSQESLGCQGRTVLRAGRAKPGWAQRLWPGRRIDGVRGF